VRVGVTQATPNLLYHVPSLSLEKFGEPLHGFPAFTASVCNARPSSRGHVRIASASTVCRIVDAISRKRAENGAAGALDDGIHSGVCQPRKTVPQW
jgi:hypothetical protein